MEHGRLVTSACVQTSSYVLQLKLVSSLILFPGTPSVVWFHLSGLPLEQLPNCREKRTRNNLEQLPSVTKDMVSISLYAPGWEFGISLTLPSQPEKGLFSLLSAQATQTIMNVTRTQSSHV